MSLVFPYTPVPHSFPVPSLGGRQARPKPLISVTLVGPAGPGFVRGLIDTGADDTTFPEAVTIRCGIDLRGAPALVVSGVGGGACLLRLAQVELRFATLNERRAWTAWVGFTATPLRYALLGFAGFLQFFDVAFLGERDVELTVNGLYPGS